MKSICFPILIPCGLLYLGYFAASQPGEQEMHAPAQRSQVETVTVNKVDDPGTDSDPEVNVGEPAGDVPSDDGDESVTPQIVSVRTTQSGTSVPVKTTVSPLDHLVHHLKQCLVEIDKWPGYTATLEQQIQKEGRLLDPELIDIKIRHQPFSVYLKWQKDGQEVLYVEGTNGNRLLAHPTRGLASLRRVWRLTPDSPQAMKGSRYPLTEIGIEKLARMSLGFYLNEINIGEGVTCTESAVLAEGRSATCFHVTFASPEVSPMYSSSSLTFDQETGLLRSVESHSWEADGRPGTLLESYRYHRIRHHGTLGEDDFSIANSEYHFQ